MTPERGKYTSVRNITTSHLNTFLDDSLDINPAATWFRVQGKAPWLTHRQEECSVVPSGPYGGAQLFPCILPKYLRIGGRVDSGRHYLRERDFKQHSVTSNSTASEKTGGVLSLEWPVGPVF